MYRQKKINTKLFMSGHKRCVIHLPKKQRGYKVEVRSTRFDSDINYQNSINK
jgi:hypothetical protein